ncbi:CpaF family protein [Actinospica robiniae]|uniref:CpaF family protein n=1 Tax=Actinospica robiniae TaxID=304901 RepID=UPI000421C42D|nr:ATPase, T2SS/T4P/T4SS family [Actinospica robiniae]
MSGMGLHSAAVEDALARSVQKSVGRILAATDEPLPRAELEVRARELIREALDANTRQALANGTDVLDRLAEDRVAGLVFAGLFGLGRFQALLDDESVENIAVNGCDEVFVTYVGGRRELHPPVAASDDELVDMIRLIGSRLGHDERRFDRANPSLNIQLPDGSRLFAVMGVSKRPSVAIRRHRFEKVSLDDLAGMGTVDPELAEVLAALVLARANILIAGGTNAGKTTFLRGLSSAIPGHERLITIEDTYELNLHADRDAHPDVVAMQAREANLEGAGAVTQADLVRMGLRMSPDRVIVGECRGDEIVPMLNAMSQGNDGSMATIHASSSAGAFGKLAAYAAQAPERLDVPTVNLLIANAVNVVIHIKALKDGTRVVSSVREVVGAEGYQMISNETYRPGRDGRAMPGAPWTTAMAERLIDAGLPPELAAHRAGWSR